MKIKQSVQQGFTLIELMIVVAIIGILAAVAVPAYQDYLVRSKVTEGLVGASEFKTAIAEYHAFRGTFPANNAVAGLSPSASYATDYVSTINISGALITVTMSDSTDLHDAGGRTIVFTADGSGQKLTWTCTAGNMQDNFLPSQCR